MDMACCGGGDGCDGGGGKGGGGGEKTLPTQLPAARIRGLWGASARAKATTTTAARKGAVWLCIGNRKGKGKGRGKGRGGEGNEGKGKVIHYFEPNFWAGVAVSGARCPGGGDLALLVQRWETLMALEVAENNEKGGGKCGGKGDVEGK